MNAGTCFMEALIREEVKCDFILVYWDTLGLSQK